MEAVRLRVKDVEFARHEIIVREGKGFKDRVTMLPDRLWQLCEHIWLRLKLYMKKIWQRGWARYLGLSRWTKNIQCET